MQMRLRAELETTSEIAVKVDSMYKLSAEECSRLRAQFKCQEDDREFLIKQVGWKGGGGEGGRALYQAGGWKGGGGGLGTSSR